MTERAANEVSQVGRTDQQMNQGWQLGSRYADFTYWFCFFCLAMKQSGRSVFEVARAHSSRLNWLWYRSKRNG